MNLTAYVDGSGKFDYDSLAADVQVAMRFMDNVCDANFYFYPQTYEMQMDIRRTGLGTMGLGDALIKMKIPYGSDKSVGVIDKIYKTIRDNAYWASSEIAEEKGSFGKFDKDKYLEGYFIKRLPQSIRDNIAKKGIRNAVLLTQAPTGTTSLLSGVSSGIEPVYNFEYKRKDRTGEHIVYHPLFEEWKNANPNTEKPDYFVCAMDLSPEEHLKVQAKVQEYTDSSISKTVNAPNEYTVEDVKRLYTSAYEMGCKGITFFRDGSRAGVLENVKEEKPKEVAADLPAQAGAPAKEETPEPTPAPVFADTAQLSLPVSPEAGKTLVARPFVVQGATYKLKTPVGTAFITINHDEAGEPLEMFINIGKAGSDVSAFAVALGRTISAALRFRSTLTPKERAFEIADQLKDIGGRRSVGFGQSRIRSLPDAISVALSAHFGFKMNGNGAYTNGHSNGNVTLTENETEQISAGVMPAATEGQTGLMFASAGVSEPKHGAKVDLCPECGELSLVFEEGCAKCYSCGHSEC
jgi:ribonucleoside-diphosphate reductase alpha chain